MLNTIERRHEIVQLVYKQERVQVPELAQLFGVSTVTIRNDLNELDEKGLLVRSRGGAVASNRLTQELSLKEKHDANRGIKERLGKFAASLIKDGESIILDSGTTTEEVAKNLTSHHSVVVMTNGLNVAHSLLNAPSVEVLMTGGTLRKKSLSFYGRQAEQHLQQYHFDKLVLGVDGFEKDIGITTHFELEALLNRVMFEVSREIIVVTDSSKFNRKGVHKIIAASEINVLVTDSGIPAEIKTALEIAGVRLHILDL
ncbi:transcriptional repressor AgaR [Pseudoalteromonas arctica]|uniref:DeoR family transcriptional regulator n=1 Tax=Pseudoalteromonas arctica TaxID=394751 RepID=A0A7Y0DS30_9GAMM|nr:transcriptional repressor AgaR [Pseudoalteromonas arctica]NMM40632.1 DeoR family transcriptional regulator [Pseudoalteromonas arctica]